MLAFRFFPAPDSGKGFRKHLARFYRFEVGMRFMAPGGGRGGAFLFCCCFVFALSSPTLGRTCGIFGQQRAVPELSGTALEGQEEGLWGWEGCLLLVFSFF
ncbi:hypothetical protein CXU01_02025 [Akkermansia muciniphila]|nr:hypothetical protein CXU01_02025 [Akkermansia muciniphila]